MASFHRVIKLLNLKSAANLHCFQWEAQSKERILLKNPIRSLSLSLSLSIAPPIGNNANSLQIWTLKAL